MTASSRSRSKGAVAIGCHSMRASQFETNNRSVTSTVKVGPPPLQSERPLSTAFQLPCPNPTAAYSRTHEAKHKGRTAAVIFITKLEGILLPDPSTDADGSLP